MVEKTQDKFKSASKEKQNETTKEAEIEKKGAASEEKQNETTKQAEIEKGAASILKQHSGGDLTKEQKDRYERGNENARNESAGNMGPGIDKLGGSKRDSR